MVSSREVWLPFTALGGTGMSPAVGWKSPHVIAQTALVVLTCVCPQCLHAIQRENMDHNLLVGLSGAEMPTVSVTTLALPRHVSVSNDAT